MNRNLLAALAATIGAIVVVAMGFAVLGGPQRQRLVRTDLRAVQALSSLAQQINAKWNAEGKTLPANLDNFPETAKKNPVTGAAFTYRQKSPQEYELCAKFITDDRDMHGSADDRWAHPKGDYCFSFDPAQNVPWPPNYWNY
jgi:hypothetical protein